LNEEAIALYHWSVALSAGRAQPSQWHAPLGMKSLAKGLQMSRMQTVKNPFLLGFDEVERAFDSATKAVDGYPPYNVERTVTADGGEQIRIVLAVAGFAKDQLEITLEGNQLLVSGKQENDTSRLYLYRGIATRQFQRGFLVADGLTVQSASLSEGLLAIELWRPAPSRITSRIEIRELG
jgi:HSP20 family molecular chaperone IbpA